MFKHVHDAISHVHEIRSRVYENTLFQGYSWSARLAGAAVTAVGCCVMRSEKFPQTVLAHIAAWGVVCALAVLLNYGSLCRWYLALAAERRELRMLRPVLDALPAFAVGAILTWVMLAHGGERWLFGVWMALFGLMHTSSRHSLPPEIWWLGWYYIACSAWHFLILGGPSFTDPTPMGITFVVGETAGSVIFYRASKKTSKTVGP